MKKTKKAKKTTKKAVAKKAVAKKEKVSSDAVIMVSVQLPNGELGTFRLTAINAKGNLLPSQLNIKTFQQAIYDGLRQKLGSIIK